MKLEQRAKELLEKIKKEDKKINSFLEINPNLVKEARELDGKKTKGKLYGKFIGIKSNINVLGLTASCASKTLENYKSTYDATVIEKIKKEDGLIVGMCNCDEFAAGSSGENSAFGVTDNPSCIGYVPGGSSSGSAAAVAAGFCDMALGSETGGSIRVPSSFCGIVGVKPSYGAVSRYGLMDLSMSLDQIGPLARNVEDVALLLSVIAGKDERDSKTTEIEKVEFRKTDKVTFGVIKGKNVDKKVEKLVEEAIKKLGKLWKEKKIEVKHLDLAVQTYHPIVWTEFFSATRRFDGRKYGKKIEDVGGEEILRRIFGGSEITKAEFAGRYYHKALQVKELIAQEFEKAFTQVDCLILPTVPVLPWKLGICISPEEMYEVDRLVIPANLAGVCAMSVPIGHVREENNEKIVGKSSGFVDKPVGLQIICGKGQEAKMLSIAREIEKL